MWNSHTSVHSGAHTTRSFDLYKRLDSGQPQHDSNEPTHRTVLPHSNGSDFDSEDEDITSSLVNRLKKDPLWIEQQRYDITSRLGEDSDLGRIDDLTHFPGSHGMCQSPLGLIGKGGGLSHQAFRRMYVLLEVTPLGERLRHFHTKELLSYVSGSAQHRASSRKGGGTSLQLRDIRQVFGGITRYTIEPRGNCILINLSNIRCIVFKDKALFLLFSGGNVQNELTDTTASVAPAPPILPADMSQGDDHSVTMHHRLVQTPISEHGPIEKSFKGLNSWLCQINNMTGEYLGPDDGSSTGFYAGLPRVDERRGSRTPSRLGVSETFVGHHRINDAGQATNSDPFGHKSPHCLDGMSLEYLLTSTTLFLPYREELAAISGLAKAFHKILSPLSPTFETKSSPQRHQQSMSSAAPILHDFHHSPRSHAACGHHDITNSLGPTPESGTTVTPYERDMIEILLLETCNILWKCARPLVSQAHHYENKSVEELSQRLSEVQQLKRQVDGALDEIHGVRNALTELLDENEDVQAMCLTLPMDRKKEDGLFRKNSLTRIETLSSFDHEEVVMMMNRESHLNEMELMLECYLQEIEAMSTQLTRIDETTDDVLHFLQLHLATIRNNFLRLEVVLNILGVVFGLVGAYAGLFGMNLKNGYEDQTHLFWYIFFAFGVFVIFIVLWMYQYLTSNTQHLPTDFFFGTDKVVQAPKRIPILSPVPAKSLPNTGAVSQRSVSRFNM